MSRTLMVLLALGTSAVVGFACGTPAKKCSVATCAGCCAADDSCQTGNQNAACGSQGNGCSICGASQSCSGGICSTTLTFTGGGSGGSGTAGGGSAGGGSSGGAAGGASGGSAGGSSGGSAGGSSGGSAGGASGGGTGGAGGGSPVLIFDAGTPPTVNLTFAATCLAPAPCGGAVQGLWHYQDFCIEDGIFNNLVSQCGGATQTQVLNRSGTAQGAVFFSPTQMGRQVSGAVDFTLFTTNSSCVQGCAFLPSLLTSFGIAGTCASGQPDGGPGGCSCSLRYPFNDVATETYSLSRNVISTATNRTFDYCVQGTSMTYKETTSSAGIARDPGISTLARQ